MYLLCLEVKGRRTTNSFRKHNLDISDGLLVSVRSYNTKCYKVSKPTMLSRNKKYFLPIVNQTKIELDQTYHKRHFEWNPRQTNPSERIGTVSLPHEDHWDQVPQEDAPQHSRAADIEPLQDQKSCDVHDAQGPSPVTDSDNFDTDLMMSAIITEILMGAVGGTRATVDGEIPPPRRN